MPRIDLNENNPNVRFGNVVIDAVVSRDEAEKVKSEFIMGHRKVKYDPTSGPRCVKFSPKLMPKRSMMTESTLAASQLQWRLAMDAMGGLYRASLHRASLPDLSRGSLTRRGVPGTHMTPAPYHCASLGRVFDAQYGRTNKVQLCGEKHLKEKSHDSKKHCTHIKVAALPAIQSCRSRTLLDECRPEFCREEKTGQKDAKMFRNQHTFELPLTCLKIQWGAREGFATHTCEDICEWLGQFGAVMFTLPFSDRSMLAAFDSVRSASACVACARGPLHAAWCRRGMYNCGEVKIHWDYLLSDDPKWLPLLRAIEKEKDAKRAATDMLKLKHF